MLVIFAFPSAENTVMSAQGKSVSMVHQSPTPGVVPTNEARVVHADTDGLYAHGSRFAACERPPAKGAGAASLVYAPR
ncbi:hypothetical protein MRX96_042750 [Rhipicephalus microplus]